MPATCLIPECHLRPHGQGCFCKNHAKESGRLGYPATMLDVPIRRAREIAALIGAGTPCTPEIRDEMTRSPADKKRELLYPLFDKKLSIGRAAAKTGLSHGCVSYHYKAWKEARNVQSPQL